MAALLVVAFFITLVYLGIAEHIRNYINLIAIQGLLLFGVAIFELHEFNTIHLVFILVETLVFKAIVVPYFLYNIGKRNNIKKIDVGSLKGFYTLLLISLIIIICFVFSYYLHDEHMQIKYFAGAISAIMIGLLLVIVRKNILTHIVAYLVIENGVFLLALAVGGDMPMMVNAAILLDIFTSVLVLGVFVNRVGDHFKEIDSEHLSELKD